MTAFGSTVLGDPSPVPGQPKPSLRQAARRIVNAAFALVPLTTASCGWSGSQGQDISRPAAPLASSAAATWTIASRTPYISGLVTLPGTRHLRPSDPTFRLFKTILDPRTSEGEGYSFVLVDGLASRPVTAAELLQKLAPPDARPGPVTIADMWVSKPRPTNERPETVAVTLQFDTIDEKGCREDALAHGAEEFCSGNPIVQSAFVFVDALLDTTTRQVTFRFVAEYR